MRLFSDRLRMVGGGGQGGGITNLVAPAITTTAIIGTEITGDDGTWSGASTFTYQWQRNTGSWVNVGGATNKDYTPVDADFGLALRLQVTADSAVANSNSTNLTIEMPAQTPSVTELIVNGAFDAWTSDDPDGWAITGESGSDRMVTQVAPDGSAGAGAARIYSSAASASPALTQSILTPGVFYTLGLDETKQTAGTLRALNGSPSLFINSIEGTVTHLFCAGHTDITIRSNTEAHDFVIDNVTCKAITVNTPLTAPAADMVLDFLYTLPGTINIGSQVWLCPRISDWSAQDYWRARLIYTGSQWNINLYSVQTGTATSQIAVTNIGTTNGVRVMMDGDAIGLYTTSDGGASWTQQGSTITSALYQTSTGVNALWTPDITGGNLLFTPP